MTEKKTRFVIVGFDGLRPDSIKKDMPALAGFISRSHRWKNYLATFPTETYVNHPSIFSGFRPNRHGIIANAYYDRSLPDSQSFFVGSSVQSILTHESAGGLIEVPTLGDRLGHAGKTLRVICANSSGSTRLQHIHADRFDGHLNCCVHDMDHILPASEREALQSRWGKGVELKFPDFEGTNLIADIFFEYELPRGLGDVTILWIGEPDHSSHEFGIQAEQTCQARKAADAAFKRVLDWWDREGKDNGVQLVVMSDHGHGTVAMHYDLKAKLCEEGWKVLSGREIAAGRPSEDCDIVMVGDYTLGLWLRQPTQENLTRLRDCLMQIDEVGMLFSQPKNKDSTEIEGNVPGTFSEAVVFSENSRGPDIRVTMRNNPSTGKLVMGHSLEIGTGNHGGLLPQEIHSLLAVNGSAFNSNPAEHTEPAGHDDFAFTVMNVLGLLQDTNALEPLPQARLLSEALTSPSGQDDRVEEETITIREGLFEQYIRRVHYQNHCYVIEGARAGDCTIYALKEGN